MVTTRVNESIERVVYGEDCRSWCLQTLESSPEISWPERLALLGWGATVGGRVSRKW